MTIPKIQSVFFNLAPFNNKFLASNGNSFPIPFILILALPFSIYKDGLGRSHWIIPSIDKLSTLSYIILFLSSLFSSTFLFLSSLSGISVFLIKFVPPLFTLFTLFSLRANISLFCLPNLLFNLESTFFINFPLVKFGADFIFKVFSPSKVPVSI